MLSVRASEFYSEISKIFSNIKLEIIELSHVANLNVEEQMIKGILNARSISQQGNVGMNYLVPSNVNLKEKYRLDFSKFRENFDYIIFDRKIIEIEQKINELFSEYGFTDFSALELVKNLKVLSEEYGATLKHNSDLLLVADFFALARNVATKYETITFYFESIYQMLKPDSIRVNNPNNVDIFQIYIRGQVDSENFISNISILNEAYADLCTLFLNVEYNRPQFIKIESGSEWISFLGDKSVVGLLIFLLSKIADYLYRIYSPEGKIKRLSEIYDIISKSPDLIQKLNELGVDVSESKKATSETLTATMVSLGKLAKSVPGFELNGKKIGDYSTHETKLKLGEAKKRLGKGEKTNDNIKSQK